jgi:hypothetical protein
VALVVGGASAHASLADEGARSLAPAMLAACKDVACVPSCDGVDAGDESPFYTAVGRFPGSFTSAGAQEAIVSLFPCGEVFSRRQAGITALVKKEKAGWRTMETIEDAFVQDECRIVDAAGRQILICQATVGPNQGIMTAALCVVSADANGLQNDCPLRVTDVAASGCFADESNPGPRHTWSAEITKWTPATVAGSQGARVEVSIAALAVPEGENMDPACERAVQRLEKAPRETLHLELAFDGQTLAATAESRKAAARFPWAIELDGR